MEKKLMHRFIITAALVALGSSAFVTESYADHKQIIRQDYEAQRAELDHDYRARREANKCAYHRERDSLRAERDRALQIDCHETRALRVRSINRELSALRRSYHLNKRQIAAWYQGEKDALRTSYELARRDVRRPVVSSRLIAEPVHAHPADCECHICNPPAVEIPICPSEAAFPRAVPRYDDYHYRSSSYGPADYGRSARTIDWASLLVSLLAN